MARDRLRDKRQWLLSKALPKIYSNSNRRRSRYGSDQASIEHVYVKPREVRSTSCPTHRKFITASPTCRAPRSACAVQGRLGWARIRQVALFCASASAGVLRGPARHPRRLHPRNPEDPAQSLRRSSKPPFATSAYQLASDSTTASRRPAAASSSSPACRTTPRNPSSPSKASTSPGSRRRRRSPRAAWPSSARPSASPAARYGRAGIRAASPTPSTSSCAPEARRRRRRRKANWRDNPWFPDVLKAERELYDFELYPDRYFHVWEGEYAARLRGFLLRHGPRRSPHGRSHPAR